MPLEILQLYRIYTADRSGSAFFLEKSPNRLLAVWLTTELPNGPNTTEAFPLPGGEGSRVRDRPVHFVFACCLHPVQFSCESLRVPLSLGERVRVRDRLVILLCLSPGLRRRSLSPRTEPASGKGEGQAGTFVFASLFPPRTKTAMQRLPAVLIGPKPNRITRRVV